MWSATCAIACLRRKASKHAYAAQSFAQIVVMGIGVTIASMTVMLTRRKKPGATTTGITMMTAIEQFAKEARKTLWPLSKDHTEYYAWDERIKELRKEKGYTKAQAQVQAAKEQPACLRLFGRHDVTSYDPEPGSHEDVELFIRRHRDKRAQDAEGVVNEQKDLSYRESLAWATEAAGRFIRTGEAPSTCPNDTAFYLYRRAIEEPKDFLGKVNQLELKAKVDSGDEKEVKRSIDEIDMMLEAFGEESADSV